MTGSLIVKLGSPGGGSYQPLNANLTALSLVDASLSNGGSFRLSDGAANGATGGLAGQISLAGGEGFLDGATGYTGGQAGTIDLNGANAFAGSQGGSGGNLTSSGNGQYSGGSLILSAGASNNGGSIDTTAGGNLTMGSGNLTGGSVTGTIAITGANTFTALQTITQGTANTGVFASTGYSLTGSNATNAFDIAGTLNTSGNPSVLRVAMTTTAAGSTTALARFLGTTTGAANIFAVLAPVADAQASAAIQIGTGLFCGEYTASSSFWFGQSNNKFTGRFAIDTSGAVVANNGYYAFGGDTFANSSVDLMIRRRAAAWLGLGTAAASPIEQTLSGCDGSGTNITGGVLNISAGRGTGTGIAGVLNFRSHAAAASGSTLNTSPVTVMQITSSTLVTISSGVSLRLGNAATTGLSAGVLAALTNASIVLTDSTGQAYRIPCII